MSSIECLKNKVPKKIYEDAVSLLDISANIKYDYLGISYATWEKLIVSIALDIVNKDSNAEFFAGILSRKINLTVKNYLKIELNKKDTRICNNLLLKLKRNEYYGNNLLRTFIYELEFLEIYFDKDLFNLLKNSCTRFNTLLKELKIENLSFIEIKKYLKTECNYDVKVDYDNIDYQVIREKYKDYSLEDIKSLIDFNSLSYVKQSLIRKYFAKVQGYSIKEAEKDLNLLEFNYKKKNINISLPILKEVYEQNKEEFNEEECLYIETFILEKKEQSDFSSKYPNSNLVSAPLIMRLEKLYYGIDDLTDDSLSKSQYMQVLENYPGEKEKFRSDILDYYYGIETPTLSITEIANLYGVDYYTMKNLIARVKKYCLSLYSNLNLSHIIDKNKYIPYILDTKYDIKEELRKVLTLYLIEGKSYEEIKKIMPKKDIASLVSLGLQRIDDYRFGIIKIEESNKNIEEIEITESDILNEINRHPLESVLSESDKEFISFYLGLKTKYNLNGEKITGKELQEKINYKGKIPVKYKSVMCKLKERKIGILTPSLIYIERKELENLLNDVHLPITNEDRYIICSLLEIKGYPLKSIQELAHEMNISDDLVRRKYRVAIINIKKYLIGEKPGRICYESDIIPNLKYFTFKERELLEDYYINKLTNKDLAEKYNITIGVITKIMYRIKTYLMDIIKNPHIRRFDYDYYYQVVDNPDFPFRGNINLAKKIFDLYMGINVVGRNDLNVIKEKLNLDIPTNAIKRIIDKLVLGVYKYQDGIRKENSFTQDDVREYYLKNRNHLTADELLLIENFLNKSLETDYNMSSDLTFLLLKSKYQYIKLSELTHAECKELINKYDSVLSDTDKLALMSAKEQETVLNVLATIDNANIKR